MSPTGFQDAPSTANHFTEKKSRARRCAAGLGDSIYTPRGMKVCTQPRADYSQNSDPKCSPSKMSLTSLPQPNQSGIVDLLTYNPMPNSQVKRKHWANRTLTLPQELWKQKCSGAPCGLLACCCGSQSCSHSLSPGMSYCGHGL